MSLKCYTNTDSLLARGGKKSLPSSMFSRCGTVKKTIVEQVTLACANFDRDQFVAAYFQSKQSKQWLSMTETAHCPELGLV
jgi:hypothetical protein